MKSRGKSRQVEIHRAPRSSPLDTTLRAVRPAIGLMLVFSLFANLLRLTIPLYMLQVIDRVLSSGNLDTLFYLTLVAVFALAAGGGISAVIRILQNRVGAWMESELLEPVLRASLDGRLTDRSIGAQSLRDVTQLRKFYGNQGLTTLFDLPWVPVFLFVIYLLHPLLGVIGIVFAVILLALAVLNDILTRAALERGSQGSSQLADSFGRGVQHANLIHAMGMLPAFLGIARGKSEDALTSQNVASERGAIVLSTIRLLRQMAQIMMLAAGAYLVLGGEATTGLMIAGSILLNLALSPIDQAVATWRGVVSLRDAQGRLRLQLAVSDEKARRGRAALSEPRGELSVERAMHIPQGRSRPVIKPVSFGLAAGQMVGIIGPAAAGKSVLARMLVGLVPPQAGTVQLDGVDLHEWLAAGLGRHVGYLPQSPAFFAGTIADNIARLDVDTPERNAAVRQAAEAVQAHGFILNLPQGYETDLDSVVPFLSQSELQKLALARAFYGMPRLVVLDEPAASLDRSGEAALVEILAAFKERGSTLVVVSQRPALMRMCDKLILLRDGVMQAFGEPEKVLKQLRDAEEDAGKRLRMLHIANG